MGKIYRMITMIFFPGYHTMNSIPKYNGTITMINLLPCHNSIPESELTCNGPRETINKFHPPTKVEERKNPFNPLTKERVTKGNTGLRRWPTGISNHSSFRNTTTRLPRNEYSNSLVVAKRHVHRNHCSKQGK